MGSERRPRGADRLIDALELAAICGRTLGGIVISVLPRRHWSRWNLPAEAYSPVSAAITIAVGFFLGLEGFLKYAGRVADLVATLPVPDGAMFNPAMGLGAVSFFTFALATPLGLACGYLLLSGVGRLATWAVGNPGGDPVLAVADAVVRRVLHRRAEERALALRHEQEGPAAPDILVTGAEGDVPDAEWVVIASRVKPGWEQGVFVVTTDMWYRLGPPEDRITPEGLRAVYSLHAVAAAEVMRGSVYYDHPRLQALQAVSAPPSQGSP